jgi:hypothetical protein
VLQAIKYILSQKKGGFFPPGSMDLINFNNLVGEAMTQFPSVFAPCFADNVNIVGRLSQAYKAADAVRINLAAGSVNLQPSDSSVYIPTYNTHAEPPKLLAELHKQFPHMQLP